MARKQQVFPGGCVPMAPQATDEDSREEAPALHELSCHEARKPELRQLGPLAGSAAEAPDTGPASADRQCPGPGSLTGSGPSMSMEVAGVL